MRIGQACKHACLSACSWMDRQRSCRRILRRSRFCMHACERRRRWLCSPDSSPHRTRASCKPKWAQLWTTPNDRLICSPECTPFPFPFSVLTVRTCWERELAPDQVVTTECQGSSSGLHSNSLDYCCCALSLPLLVANQTLPWQFSFGMCANSIRAISYSLHFPNWSSTLKKII